MIFRSNIDRRMVNTGAKVKPFLSIELELREYFLGPIRYCSIQVEKKMDNIGDDTRPYFVKVWERVKVKVLGIRLRDRELFWTYNKL